MPKVVSYFHLFQCISLSYVSPKSSLSSKGTSSLCHRCKKVTLYLQKTKSFRKSNRLFVACWESVRKNPLLWISRCIEYCCTLAWKPVFPSLKTQSMRTTAASVLSLRHVPVVERCKAATCSSVQKFTKYFFLELALCFNAQFVRTVLQSRFS